MSTRAIYTFYEQSENAGRYHVFKSSDGHPMGACQWIRKARNNYLRNSLGFEADKFAASFVAANNNYGDIRLCSSHDSFWDILFRYEISWINEKLYIIVYDCRVTSDDNSENIQLISTEMFRGTIYEVEKWAIELDKKVNKAYEEK